MQVKLKLFAQLGRHLPEGARRNMAEVKVAEGMSVTALLDAYNVPPHWRHLVLVNGVFQPPEARDSLMLADGDELAVWPPVAGG